MAISLGPPLGPRNQSAYSTVTSPSTLLNMEGKQTPADEDSFSVSFLMSSLPKLHNDKMIFKEYSIQILRPKVFKPQNT